MKKIFNSLAVMAVSVMFTACGFGTTGQGVGSALLGTAASTLLGNGGNSTTGSALASTGLNLLSSLLGGNNQVSNNSITGTWIYAQPQVTFESSNVLAKLGGEVAGNKIENLLGTQLNKIGLTAGKSSFTFDGNGNVTVTMGTKKTTGTYTLSGTILTMKGALGLASLNCTVSIVGNQLYMLFDTSAILGAMTKLGSSNTTLSGLLGNYSGMKLGWSCTK